MMVQEKKANGKKVYYIKGQKVNIFGFADHVVSVVTVLTLQHTTTNSEWRAVAVSQ